MELIGVMELSLPRNPDKAEQHSKFKGKGIEEGSLKIFSIYNVLVDQSIE